MSLSPPRLRGHLGRGEESKSQKKEAECCMREPHETREVNNLKSRKEKLARLTRPLPKVRNSEDTREER